LLAKSVPIVLFADEWGGFGGTAGYVVMLGRELKARGYTVAALCHGGEGTQNMRDRLSDAGIEVLLLPKRGGPGPLRQARELVALASMLRRYRGGVLALMMGYFTRGGGVTIAGRLAGMKAVVRADLTPPEPPITPAQARQIRLKDRITDRVVVGAIENIDAFERDTGRNRKRLRVIHTGIELGRFRPGEWRTQTRQVLGYGRGDVVVGTTARLDDERKGVRDFIHAAARLHTQGYQARYLIVGDGVHRAAYESLASELGIADLVRFAGWRSDIPQLLDAMDVFVMASTHEGGPTSVLEAMAMSKAIVATRVGMVPEVIEDGVTGRIVPPSNPQAIADALSSLLGDPSTGIEMGTRARAAALETLGIERMAEDYLRLFADVVSS
jgi:glycosyltransferase involved in cell wall biosynthesis